ncbi:hypothetical protein ACQP2T_32070 [Nonomuraea sp. CA-143628]|uniref:hypothetical protein n=1 Tax=Nonomuraea sp. CA-143628 TaxID=3239997 RepID=UPI003D89BE13
MTHRDPTPATPPLLGELHKAGGRRSGTGGPAVAVLPWKAATGLNQLNPHERITVLTTSAPHHRGDTGWSESVDPQDGRRPRPELTDMLLTIRSREDATKARKESDQS